MKWKRIRLEETDSTNIYINKVEQTNIIVSAEFQTAGRGQGTNKWESEYGKNLLFSLKVSPTWMLPRRQFLLSMIGALAVRDALAEYTDGITAKWPNDIYWHDKKISGTLIQTTLSESKIQDFIFGVGININQRSFRSDAPNPVSLWQITGIDTDREEVLNKVLIHFEYYYTMLSEGNEDRLQQIYLKNLYRKEGFYYYEDKEGTFEAEIVGINHSGHIILRDRDGNIHEYEFKEVKFII